MLCSAAHEAGLYANCHMVENMGYLSLHGMAEAVFALRIREGQQVMVLSADAETRVRRGGCTFLIAPGQAMILSSGDRFDLQIHGAGRRYLVSFTDEALKNGLLELDIMPDLSLREPGPRPVGLNQRSDLSLYIEELMSRSGGETGARIAVCYNTIILLLIIEAFYRPSIQECGNGSGGQYEAIIKRYISDNIAGELSLEELASCAGISKRQVYNLFNNLFGMTPGEYIRRARLLAVHREISSCLIRENITDIALKYGFSNPGRFSQQYKAYVGELPSQTLKKRLRGEGLQQH
ncbi:AraC family transcriptional regulator [Marinobacterium sp. D7]|uniref:helix-turn-helix transcriptional regulator n=1 Tax=Marinobacterium ramblicola TaxID=2849041 RepID=UPI001C2CF9E2|nr:AraC family transcriptional regulator [Marinobacterium ramblicola]MBV1790728.1 AraC family transcriptional regulator [Marinobacterium ramblicola]